MMKMTLFNRLLLFSIPFLVMSMSAMSEDRDEAVNCGSLYAIDKQGQPAGMCPLKHTDVKTEIAGFIARVTVTQQFENPYETPIEAIYTFPLSEKGAVDRMEMTIGDRTIHGVIKERDEARQIYEAAKAAGQRASLLDQERPNIFTQSVANIMPGDAVTITLSYVEYLKYEDGEYTFAFPMVVGPRYIPGAPASPPDNVIESDVKTGLRAGPASTDQVPDASRVNPPVTSPGTRAGHDISVQVQIDAGVPIKNISSPSHEIMISHPGSVILGASIPGDDNESRGATASINLKEQAELPNRDFILKYAVAGGEIEDAVLVHADDRGGFFTLIMQPPHKVPADKITPKEMIFVIDRSGSMSGFPIEKAKATMAMAIKGMNPDDTFNLLSFAGGTGMCFRKPVANTDANRSKALAYLKDLEGSGGTEMMKAVMAALEGQDDPERLRVVCFMTDGYIGNDMAILDAIQKNAGTARVFSFGIGSSVNRFLIEGMAREGRGEAEIVTLASDGDAAAQRFHERIQSPLLTDISLDFSGVQVREVYPAPKAVPDLFSATPLILTGRYNGSGECAITVRGNTAEGPFERQIRAQFPAVQQEHDVLATLWARKKVESIMAANWMDAQLGKPTDDVKGAIVDLGLTYNLVTQYTSFVAVEDKVVNEGGNVTKVQVPVEMPDGVSYEGIFGSDAAEGEMMQWQALGYSSGGGGGFGGQAVAGKAFRGAAPMSPPPITLAEPAGRERIRTSVAPESAPMAQSEEKDEAAASTLAQKLDPALHNLKSKLTQGSYRGDDITVTDGKVKVFILVDALSEENLAQLKKLGVKILAQTASTRTIHAELEVDNLEAVAALTFVTRITPPKF